jgi:hypothetical protein
LTLRTSRGLRAILLLALTLLAAPLVVRAQSDLSAGQQAQARARQGRFQTDVAALRADPNMTKPQKLARYQTLYQSMDKDMLAILSPDQRAVVLRQRGINLKFQRQVAALRADTKMPEAQKKQRYLALLQATDQQSLATLTPAQRARVLARRQAQEEAQALDTDLRQSQTPDQKKKIDAIAHAAGIEIQGVIGDKSLDQTAKVAKINDLQKQAAKRISALLTPEQRTKYARVQKLVGVQHGR